MAGRSSRSGGNSNERIQLLVEQKLGEGLQYEALQLYRGVVSRKSARGNDNAALTIAEQGIGVLLARGYADSATELGNVLVGILNDHELPVTEERLELFRRVNAKYEDAKRAAVLAEEDRRTAAQEGQGGVGEVEEGKEAGRGMYSVGVLQGRFLKLAVAWTAARGQRLSGDPGLCGLLGRCLWNEGDLERGTRYLVLGERPQELCDLILQDVSDANARELAVAKGVLQFASKASLRDANALLAAYKTQTGGKQPTKGVLGFCAMLLKTCEYDATPVFQKLLDAYQADLSKDEALFGSVESIAMTYFNLRLRPPSMLDNIMGMLGGMPK
ncbi:conserved unknown protein [Ectocarpus siliculosus]|uniref:Golgi to ER traffic protein 4 n=1 Tax=Ectocarpus siliculosus TaxID=2880 RepID=D7FHY1_ECTSI|nr:conserved unknown protein [Ectocarpus siliculosus]|eukprot:CBJ48992.1 conserved unknown protein [Ectocarpus siliculosus]